MNTFSLYVRNIKRNPKAHIVFTIAAAMWEDTMTAISLTLTAQEMNL